MVVEHWCGETGTGSDENDYTGSEEIVGIEGAFTGRALTSLADPTGLGMILARIDRRYWPLFICGDSGIGALFNVEDNKNQNLITTTDPIDPDGTGVVAHACLLDCNYTITVNTAASVIIAKIDGVYNILRVLHTSFTGGITSPDVRCRCCGFSVRRTKLRARVLQVHTSGSCTSNVCDEFVIDLANRCEYSELNPLGIRIECDADATSEYEELDDWTVTVCGQTVEILSFDCDAPYEDCTPGATGTGTAQYCECPTEEGSCGTVIYQWNDPPGEWVEFSNNCAEGCTAPGEPLLPGFEDEQQLTFDCEGTPTPTGTGTLPTRFEMTIRTGPLAECDGCDYTILIYTDPLLDEDPCALEDEIIDTVEAEACGLPNLNRLDRVIIAKVPRTPGTSETGTGSYGCPPVEWYIIRACNVEDCSDNCDDPPIPPAECCGIQCTDLVSTLSATIEILDCICECDSTKTLTKQECIEGTETGEWRYDPDPDEVICDTVRGLFTLEDVVYRCGEEITGTGTGTLEHNSSLVVNGITGVLVSATCDPFMAVFEFDLLTLCEDKTPGMLPPADLNCRARITITE